MQAASLLNLRQLKSKLTRIQHFFSDDLWEARLDTLPKWQALRYRALRIGYCAVDGLFFSDAHQLRAAALTYFTVLSLVPLLAFVFAMLKGFGAYDALVENSLRPYMLSTFAGNPALQRALEQILAFVGDTNVTRLGFLGLLALLYAAARLLRNIEESLNQIWGVKHGRGPLRQVTDYVAIVMVTPFSLLLAAGLTTATQIVGPLQTIQERLGIGSVIEWTISLVGPFIVITVALVFLYMVMPNTSVRWRSALVGALVGGVIWYAVLLLHVNFQLGVARFNALYSSFGVIPIFLVWVYVSWTAVMVGAQAAATHQHDQAIARRARIAGDDQAFREAATLSALLRITRAFMAGESQPKLSELSKELETPEALLSDLLARCERAGFIAKTGVGSSACYVLGRMPDQVLVKQVIDALRQASHPEADKRAIPAAVDPAAAELLAALDRDLTHSQHNISLAELAAENQRQEEVKQADDRPHSSNA